MSDNIGKKTEELKGKKNIEEIRGEILEEIQKNKLFPKDPMTPFIEEYLLGMPDEILEQRINS